jgi:hypothetical protein
MLKWLAQVVTAVLWGIHVTELHKFMLTGFQDHLALFEQKMTFSNSMFCCNTIDKQTHFFTSKFGL